MAKNIALTLGWLGILNSKFRWSFFWIIISSVFVPYPIVTALTTLLPFWFLTLMIPLKMGTRQGSFNSIFYTYIGTMLFSIIIFANIYFKEGLYISGVITNIDFWDALYFSITTWTTLGYGDFSPTPACRLITSIEAILGYYAMAIFIVLSGLFITNGAETVDCWFYGIKNE